MRDVQTLTLFIGNNRLQLQQFGAEPEDTLAGTPGDGSMAALMLRPIGTLSMIGLMLHGAMGRLGEAAGVEGFEFQHMVVKPTLAPGRKEVVVAFDGEVARMRAPIDIRVLDKPLYLLPSCWRSGHGKCASGCGMSVLLQISDTHFGTEQPQVVEALVALAAQQRPDVVVLSGDITQRARPAQFLRGKGLRRPTGRAGSGHPRQPRHCAVRPLGTPDAPLRALWRGVRARSSSRCTRREIF